MISTKEEKWLKGCLESFCRDSSVAGSPSKKLAAFSMLVKTMTATAEEQLAAAERLWRQNPASEELREKFGRIRKILAYIKRYCSEKVEKGGNNG
jgi:hypothetical protein